MHHEMVVGVQGRRDAAVGHGTRAEEAEQRDRAVRASSERTPREHDLAQPPMSSRSESGGPPSPPRPSDIGEYDPPVPSRRRRRPTPPAEHAGLVVSASKLHPGPKNRYAQRRDVCVWSAGIVRCCAPRNAATTLQPERASDAGNPNMSERVEWSPLLSQWSGDPTSVRLIAQGTPRPRHPWMSALVEGSRSLGV